MQNGPFLYAALAALCFGGWPLIARAGGAASVWLTLCVTCGGLAVAWTNLAFHDDQAPSSRAVMYALAGGLVNGLGLVFFGKVAIWKGEDVSRLLPLVFVMMTLVTVAASVVFLHEPITSKKIVGVVLACAAMWFLN